MVIVNVGSGYPRPPLPWINIDNLHDQFPIGTPERREMDNEPNFVNANVIDGLPFDDSSVDGILMSHILEHFTMNDAFLVLRHCWHVLKPGGILRISVPDPAKFYRLTMREVAGDVVDWGQPNYGAPTPFMNYALFFAGHKQLIGIDALKCYLHATGFSSYRVMSANTTLLPPLSDIDNRAPFSLFVEGIK